MEFGKITRSDKAIEVDEWAALINDRPYLEPVPDQIRTNPFTGEELVAAGIGRAFYSVDGERIGGAGLEQGQILTTGIPLELCQELADELGATAERDDRS